MGLAVTIVRVFTKAKWGGLFRWLNVFGGYPLRFRRSGLLGPRNFSQAAGYFYAGFDLIDVFAQ